MFSISNIGPVSLSQLEMHRWSRREILALHSEYFSRDPVYLMTFIMTRGLSPMTGDRSLMSTVGTVRQSCSLVSGEEDQLSDNSHFPPTDTLHLQVLSVPSSPLSPSSGTNYLH